QLGGGDRADADVHLALSLDALAELELGAAAGDLEAGDAGGAGVLGEGLVQRERDVQVAGADGGDDAGHAGLRAVDGDAGIRPEVLAVGERSADRLDAD